MKDHESILVSLSLFLARSLLSTTRCVHLVRHVIATAACETAQVGCLVTKLTGVPIYPSTRIFMWKAYLFPARCRDSHFMREDISRRCKTRCASNLILYRSYRLSRGYIGSWRSRARFGGKLDSENFDVISRFRENPLGWTSMEMRIAFSSRSLFCRRLSFKVLKGLISATKKQFSV